MPPLKIHGNVGPKQQLAGIVNGLLIVPCANAAAHHCDHGQTNGLPRDAAHAVQIVCHGIGGDLHGAEGGDHAHHQNAARLEQAVLKGGRDADARMRFAIRPSSRNVLGTVSMWPFW